MRARDSLAERPTWACDSDSRLETVDKLSVCRSAWPPVTVSFLSASFATRAPVLSTTSPRVAAFSGIDRPALPEVPALALRLLLDRHGSLAGIEQGLVE